MVLMLTKIFIYTLLVYKDAIDILQLAIGIKEQLINTVIPNQG